MKSAPQLPGEGKNIDASRQNNIPNWGIFVENKASSFASLKMVCLD